MSFEVLVLYSNSSRPCKVVVEAYSPRDAARIIRREGVPPSYGPDPRAAIMSIVPLRDLAATGARW